MASRDFVQSLDRGLRVIQAFSERESLTVSEIAELTGFSRPTVRRLLLTLQELGYVTQSEGHFHLTPRVLTLAYSYLSGVQLSRLAQPHLERVAEKTSESCSMGALDDTDVVYLAGVPTKWIMRVTMTVGTRLPAYASSLGRAILAYLPAQQLDRYFQRAELRPVTPHTITDEGELRAELARIREHGWALVDQEFEIGLRSLGVPVHNADGKVVASVNCSTHVGRVDRDTLVDDFRPLVEEAAARIGEQLGHGLLGEHATAPPQSLP
jgi:IclR family pca regulon transcriptional regulator